MTILTTGCCCEEPPPPDDVGACCHNEGETSECTDEALSDCNDIGGTWHPGILCQDYDCNPAPGNGLCPEDCQSGSGFAQTINAGISFFDDIGSCPPPCPTPDCLTFFSFTTTLTLGVNCLWNAAPVLVSVCHFGIDPPCTGNDGCSDVMLPWSVSCPTEGVQTDPCNTATSMAWRSKNPQSAGEDFHYYKPFAGVGSPPYGTYHRFLNTGMTQTLIDQCQSACQCPNRHAGEVIVT